jgi:cytohesin
VEVLEMSAENFVRALLKRDLVAVSEMLARGQDINSACCDVGWVPLHYAAEHNLIDVATWLLDHGADPNVRDNHGQAPLYISIDSEADSARQRFVATGNEDISSSMTELLLRRGADPNARRNNGKSLLALARGWGHLAAVDLLIKYGAHE